MSCSPSTPSTRMSFTEGRKIMASITAILLFNILPTLEAFSSPLSIFKKPSSRDVPLAPTSKLNVLPPDLDLASTLITSVDVFDGSSIVDPVVVSGSFWGSLQRQLVSVILGQFLAAIVFGAIATFFASQLNNVKEMIFSTLLNDQNGGKKQFIRADSPEYRRANVQPDYGKLLICLLIDFVGNANEIIPFVGEFADIVSAPLAATALQNLFGGSKMIFFFEFAEEILPFTDIIPFATICWVVDTYFPESDIAGVFQLGKYKNAAQEQDAIDTTAADVMDITKKR